MPLRNNLKKIAQALISVRVFRFHLMKENMNLTFLVLLDHHIFTRTKKYIHLKVVIPMYIDNLKAKTQIYILPELQLMKS